MSINVALRTVDCPICGSKDSKSILWTRDYLFEVSNQDFGVRRCSRCGAGFLSPRPANIRPFYPEDFYWAWEGAGESLGWSEIIARRKAQLSAKAAWLEGTPPGRLLDIGAQKGEFLWYMRQLGWDVEGIELDEDVPNPSGMPMIYGDFLAMDFGDKRYDAITFWAVLEHVEDPASFFRKAHELLNPGGIVIVLVTNFNSIQSRVYGADDYPRHLTLFTKKSVDLLCRKNGFHLEKTVTDQSIFGGSLNGGLVYLTKRLLGYSSHDAMREWKQNTDPDLFWTKFRSRPSLLIRITSKIDRITSLPIEMLLDRLGFGFIFTFSAKKR